MNARVAVAKMHGARNDFIVVDARSNPLTDPASFAQEMCDRHAGIGADGLLLIERSDVADIKMRIINADGSEAEMCGNGIRCVARFSDEKNASDFLRIETLAGIIDASIITRGETYQVRVRMGIPKEGDASGLGPDAAVFSVGNPHFVRFVHEIDNVDLQREGEALQHHPSFRNGVNVHLVRVLNPHTIEVRHFERGAGLTMACGTGAVASAAAAIARNVAHSPVTVRVPGGELTVEWDGSGEAYMTGPAVHVFDTEVTPLVRELR